MSNAKSDELLREEFNRWADAGKGESMESDHWPITRPVLEMMHIRPTDNILDVGCGGGWLSKILARGAPEGRVVGMDISDEMIHRARNANAETENLAFIVGGVDEIPWEANLFTHAISVESSYYWPDPAKGIREIHRVLADGGQAWIDINFYKDNPNCHQWAAELKIPTHLLSAQEWEELFRKAGFKDVKHQTVPDPTPNPETYTGRWFRDAKQLAEFRAMGALLIHGRK